MTLRSFTTWLLPLASIAFFTACGGRSFDSGGPQPCQGNACGAGSCTVGNYRYLDGAEGIPKGDGCNTCGCDNGVAMCTSNVCGNGGSGNTAGTGSGGGGSGCQVDGEQFANGASDIAAPDGCNTCSCVNGELVCTEIGCTSNSCTYNGTFYLDGDSFQAIDGCNTCTCVEGEVACTLVDCVDPGQCLSDLDCDMGQLCQTALGLCGGAGTCVDTAVACDLSYVPVCGCDGVTYGNECGALSAGMNVAYQGECGSVTPLCGGATCSDTQFCKYPEGYCFGGGVVPLQAGGGGGAGAPVPLDPGTCTDIAAGCPDIYSPVCGCNGLTYASACEADAAGVSVNFQGECPVSCFDATGCQMGEYCMYSGGFCGGIVPVAAQNFGGAAAPIAIAPSGTCQPVPEGCPADYTPVCGCDGVTYGNACGAAAASMSVAYDGECMVAVAQ